MITCCLYSLDQYLGEKFAVKLLNSIPLQAFGFCTSFSSSHTALLKCSVGVTHLSAEEDVLQHTSSRLVCQRGMNVQSK